MSRSRVVGAIGLVWCVAAAVVVAHYWPFGAPVLGVGLTVLPAAPLFVYVARRPSRMSVLALAIAGSLGLAGVVVNARYMASPSCLNDAMYEANVVTPAVGGGLLFGAVCVTYGTLERRRPRAD